MRTLLLRRAGLLALLLTLSLAAGPSAAQTAEEAALLRPDPQAPVNDNMAVPLAWKVRLDRPSDDVVIGAEEGVDIWFVNMTPGWHVTTGPAAIFYHPASTAEGAYRAESAIHFFDPQGRNEGYGMFVGGSRLEGDEQAYLYFLLRNSGEFLVKRRVGAETAVVHPWTAHPAVVRFDPEAGESSVKNVLAVEAGADDVAFFVNDAEVARLPKGDLPTDGVVGLRFNHHVNVHVSDLKVTPAE